MHPLQTSLAVYNQMNNSHCTAQVTCGITCRHLKRDLPRQISCNAAQDRQRLQGIQLTPWKTVRRGQSTASCMVAPTRQNDTHTRINELDKCLRRPSSSTEPVEL